MLRRQKSRCYWCGRSFGSFERTGPGTSRLLEPVWDHREPFSFTGSCKDSEFVAACALCNGHKGDKVFGSDEECRAYLMSVLKGRVEFVAVPPNPLTTSG